MIVVSYQFTSKTKQFKSIKIQGHASWAPKGQDLVCAGVSAIVNGAVNFWQKYYPKNCQIQVSVNQVAILVLFSSWQIQLSLTMFFFQLKNISLAYPDCFQFTKTKILLV